MSQRPTPQKTIGILGGMSDQATAHYYRLLNQTTNQRLGGWEIAETLIQGVNFGNIEAYVRADRWDEAQAYLERKALQAQAGGADLLLCASNTMHRVLHRLPEILTIPFLHIVDPTAAAIQAAGLSTVGLLGTQPVMASDFMHDRFRQQFGIDTISPGSTAQAEVDRIIFDELVKGRFTDASRARYVAIARELQAEGAQAIVLACTEIFLLLRPEDVPGLPLFDTTALHVAAAVDAALAS